MRLMFRAFSGVAIWSITIALFGAAGWQIYSSLSDDRAKKPRMVQERSYIVDVAKLQKTSVAPVVKAYGLVRAWNSLEVRAPSAGPVTEISPRFREGMTVEAGELLFRIDPEIAARRVTDAKAALEQAETEREEASQTQKLNEAEISAAKAEGEVRRLDLVRKKKLFSKKLTTSTIHDDAVLALSAAKQNIVAKERELLALKARILKADAGVARAKIVLSDAERLLQDTTYRAPFSGRLSEVTLTLGRRVSENEKLGILIDPNALEVSFPVRNSDFGRLLDPNDQQKVAPLPVTVTLDLSGKRMSAAAVLDRPSAVASTVAGRTLFARITDNNINALRPGDFVTVSVTEPKVAEVAVIPSDAATLDGRVLLIGDDLRLKEHATQIVRRQGDNLIVKNVPFGQSFVLRRLPFLASGTRVQPKTKDEAETSGTPIAAKSHSNQVSQGLTTKHRAALIAFVKTRQKMPEKRRAQLLQELQKTHPEQQVVERIQRRMANTEKRS